MNLSKTKGMFILIKLLFIILIYIIKTYKTQVHNVKKVIKINNIKVQLRNVTR